MAQLLYNSCFDTNKMPADLDSFFDYFVEKQSSESAILILPTNKYVQKAKFDFVQKNFEKNKKPTQKLHFYRLQDFAYHCLNKAFPNNNRRVISNAATLYLMEKAANYVEIKYYRSGRKNISLPILKQLMTIILGLKEDGITPFTMKNDLECEQNIASGDLRFNDIQLLYAKYEELLGDNYLDVPSVYYKITDEIDKIIAQNQDNLFTSIIPSPMDNFPIDNLFSNKNTVILFYGFTEFKLPEAQFVSRFAWSKIPTVVNIDYSHISGPEIQSLSRNVRRLAVSGHNQISTDLLKNIHNSDNLSISEYITKWIFNEEHTLHNPKILTQVKIFEAVDRIDEVKNLANLVRYLHKTKNVELSDICICSRKPELYSDLFREIFSESGLIINISDRFSLANSPSIVFIFSLLNIVINHWKYKDIERISENIIIKNKIPNIAILSTVAKKYRISGGIGKNSIEYWKKSFEKYLEFTEEILKKIDNICVDDIEIRNILKDKAELEQANLAFTELAKLINFTNSKISYHDFFEIIQEILAKFEIVENIYKQYFNIYNYNKIHSLSDFQLLEEIEKNAKSLNKFIDILEEFAKIEEECEPNAKYKLSEIVDKFKNAISGEKYQISEKNNLGVNITSIEQSRGIAYKIMILCGAVDSEFPMPFKTDTLLGRELPESEAIHNDNERILFYQFLTNNKKQLDAGEHEIYIFYPKEDAGKQLVRSPFIDDLLNISTNSHSNVFSINEIRQNHIPYLNQKELEWIFYLSQSTDILTDKIINMNKNSFFGTQDENINRIFDNLNEQKNTSSFSDAALQNIENLKNKTYTITELETYAECAFRYFAKNIAKISPEITFDKTLSSLETGNYLHSILYKFYSYYCNLSQNFLYEFKYFDVDDKDKPIYLNKLLEIANNEIKPVDIPIYQYEIEKIVGKNGKLEFWINNEIEKLKQWNFSSILFEYSFGMKNSPIELKNSYGKCIKIRGKIDRIELYNFKQNDNKIYFVVADYKTSATSIPSANQIKDGKSLQVPIYLKIMQNIFENKNFQPAGGVYYNLASELNSHKDFYKTPIKICFPEGTDEKQGEFLQLLENSVDYAINYKEKIENLFFAPNETNACKYCEYSRICRIKEKKYNLQK